MKPKWSKNVKFHPWIGDNYHEQAKKILILGDSHYDWYYEGEIVHVKEKDSTQGYIDGLIHPEIRAIYKNKGTWTKLEKAFLGNSESKYNENTIFNFWNSVVFYNFVQRSVPGGARVSPAPDHFIKSIPAFQEVISILKPQIMIVLGVSRLWPQLPPAKLEKPIVVEGREIETCTYDYKNGRCFAFPVFHPSAGFTPDYWGKVIIKGICRA